MGLMSPAHAIPLVQSFPDDMLYEGLVIDDQTIPRDIITHLNELLKPEGLSEFDEQNLGNIPF